MSDFPVPISKEEIKDRYSPRDEKRGRSRSPERDRRRSSPEERGLTQSAIDEANNSCCVYIAKLSRGTRESEIREAFSRYGPIKSLIMKSSYAFLTYETPEAATEAIARMNGAKFVNGEEIVVEQSGTDHYMTTLLGSTQIHAFSARNKEEVQWTTEG
jgi:RNA recognition motif-containing protein